MFKLLGISALASVLWLGGDFNTSRDGEFPLGFSSADAKQDGERGNSGDKGSGNKGADGKARAEQGGNNKGGSLQLGKGNEASQLKGLNSLKRNVNGLINSSDPRLAGFQGWYEGLSEEELANIQEATSEELVEAYLNASNDKNEEDADLGTWFSERLDQVKAAFSFFGGREDDEEDETPED